MMETWELYIVGSSYVFVDSPQMFFWLIFLGSCLWSNTKGQFSPCRRCFTCFLDHVSWMHREFFSSLYLVFHPNFSFHSANVHIFLQAIVEFLFMCSWTMVVASKIVECPQPTVHRLSTGSFIDFKPVISFDSTWGDSIHISFQLLRNFRP
jgi:hypothetical protein